MVMSHVYVSIPTLARDSDLASRHSWPGPALRHLRLTSPASQHLPQEGMRTSPFVMLDLCRFQMGTRQRFEQLCIRQSMKEVAQPIVIHVGSPACSSRVFLVAQLRGRQLLTARPCAHPLVAASWTRGGRRKSRGFQEYC